MRRWICVLLFAACSGCGFDDSNVAPNSAILPIVPKNEVPEHVRQAAREHRPDLKFGGVFRTPQGYYQFRARDRKGNGIAIDVTPDGVVVQLRTY